MVLRDLYCTACGNEVHDVDSGAASVDLDCDVCGRRTRHDVVCNGGTRGERWRFADAPYDTDSWMRGRTHAMGVSVNGQTMINNGDDKREARRDRLHSDRRRSKGRAPIVFDGKRNG